VESERRTVLLAGLSSVVDGVGPRLLDRHELGPSHDDESPQCLFVPPRHTQTLCHPHTRTHCIQGGEKSD